MGSEVEYAERKMEGEGELSDMRNANMLTPEHRAKGQKRVRKVLQVWRATERRHPEWYANDGELAQKMLRTRVLCSGPCCGNPRKWWGKRTIQELKSDAEMRHQLALVGE
ncbi:unnamed protein product, partial [marine sediment metagenome]